MYHTIFTQEFKNSYIVMQSCYVILSFCELISFLMLAYFVQIESHDEWLYSELTWIEKITNLKKNI